MPSPDVLAALQRQFHAVIRQRAGDLVEEHRLALPDFSVDPPGAAEAWFPVPGMAGGFAYRLVSEDPPVLRVDSWSRMVGGSGERHEVTAEGARLIDSGFV